MRQLLFSYRRFELFTCEQHGVPEGFTRLSGSERNRKVLVDSLLFAYFAEKACEGPSWDTCVAPQSLKVPGNKTGSKHDKSTNKVEPVILGHVQGVDWFVISFVIRLYTNQETCPKRRVPESILEGVFVA